MIKGFLYLFILLPLFARAHWEEVFSNDEDPAIFHHVNVITGNLYLSFQDHLIEGAKPLPIIRSYSSAGALEATTLGPDHALKELRGGWLIQTGWGLFPHANLLITTGDNLKSTKVYLPEPSGGTIVYVYSGLSKGVLTLKPECKGGQSLGVLSAKNNLKNYRMEIYLGKGKIKLFLPTGGYRLYQDKGNNSVNKRIYFLLTEEMLPSGHRIHYGYDKEKRLVHVALKTPNQNKTLSELNFDLKRTKTPYQICINTSDGKNFNYKAMDFKYRDYLFEVWSNARFFESLDYQQGRKGIGARVQSVKFERKNQFQVEYYLPPDHHHENRWCHHPNEKPFHIDRVQRIQAPLGPNGEMVEIAHFSYAKNHTDVRDVNKLLQRFHHDGKSLQLIEYFDEKDRLFSSIRFIYDQERLKSKVFLNATGEPLFAKTFQYDSVGNVIEETFWGNISGSASSFTLNNTQDALTGAESYRKKYQYVPGINVPQIEEEEEGITYRYTYKPGTDLVTSKLICDGTKVLIRNFYSYNEDNLVVSEIVDDGSAADPNDLSQITFRQIKQHSLDAATGLVKSTTESYLDVKSSREIIHKTTENQYSTAKKVIQESISDSRGKNRYTLHTEYNEQGQVTKKTNPLGQVSDYQYDPQGRVIKSKEIGQPEKIHTYDAAGRLIEVKEIDKAGNVKVTRSSYDAKGRLLAQVDARGNTTEQTYDAFGRCLSTRFPAAFDEKGNAYRPTIELAYDISGNIALEKSPRGETTQTSYNAFRKPTRIIHADKKETLHYYNKNGSVAKTICQDKSEIHYTYDLFKRMTSKTIYSSSQEKLSTETWQYNAFHLLSHTDPQGLTATYTYDFAGRKMGENAGGRITTHTYDDLGFQERITQGEMTSVKIHDVGGRVIEQWDEDAQGTIENRMTFFYNNENKKAKALRHTSQGVSTDLFEYDSEGRLTRHIDPYGQSTQIFYNEKNKNDLGQAILQKTTIDPLGNQTCEIFDAANRLIAVEKKNPQNQIVAKEQIFYDCSGNKSKIISTIFHETRPQKILTTIWEHDEMGRVIKEIESNRKITTYSYDAKGRLSRKILPRGIALSYCYDATDRLLEIASSDRSVHYQYLYDLGKDPIAIVDLVNNIRIERQYNNFGDVIQEIHPAGYSLHWEYDSQGRCTRMSLPDNSSIAYHYQGLHMRSIKRISSANKTLYEHRYAAFDPNGHVTKDELALELGNLLTQRDLMERPVLQQSSWQSLAMSFGPSGLVSEVQSSLHGNKKYSYDPLSQLIQEGDHSYRFDSLGNPTEYEVNDLNQITSKPEEKIIYDEDGNPQQRITSQGTIQYSYDALGRLTSLTFPQKRKVLFFYDPLSRLYAKVNLIYRNSQYLSEGKLFFLHDKDREIGLLDSQQRILQLKVLGLGIKEDIGAAIALELQGEIFVPLHDFQGNIIALVNSNGQLLESYSFQAFGVEKLSTPSPLNPWRFCSKRSEEGLVFFSKRFYDPSLGRWLTPDPSGFTEGSNLYLYVLNNPLNRLDLFGLISEAVFPNIRIEASIQTIQLLASARGKIFLVPGSIEGVPVDFVVANGAFHQLNFSPEELQTGKVNIIDHLHELLPKESSVIGIVTAQNGIGYELKDYIPDMCNSIVDLLHSDTLFLAPHHPSQGFNKDTFRLAIHKWGAETETKSVSLTRQFLVGISERIYKINPQLLWLHIAHSEGGLLGNRAIQGMTPDQQSLLKKQLYIYAFGPVEPIPRNYGLDVKNFYSTKDYLTHKEGYEANPKDYNVHFLPSISKWHEKNLFYVDHMFKGATYQKGLQINMYDLSISPGFYHAQVR